MRISCNQLPERFDRRSARTCKLLLLGLALMISGCASSPPPARWYSQAEASSTIERLAGSSAPQGVVIYPYYEEAWSIQQPKEFMQSRYSCNKSTTLTGKSALKLTISGNFVEGELIKSDDCGDVTRESVRGRFNENYLFVQFGSAGTAIRRYKIADGGRMLLPEVNMTLSGTHTFPRNGQIMTESRNGKTYWTTEFVATANGSQREQQLVEEARDGARAAKQARNESERADQRLAMALLQAPQAYSAPSTLPGAQVSSSTTPQPAKTQTTRSSGAQSPVSIGGSGVSKSRQPAVLTFLFQVPLEFQKGDTNNSNCWVLVSVPGPAGFLESNDLTQVNSVIDTYKPRALQQCRTTGRRVTGDASAGVVDDTPSKLGQARSAYNRQAGQNAQYRFEIH